MNYFLLVISLLLSINAFGTIQSPDILIFGNDTMYMLNYPLNDHTKFQQIHDRIKGSDKYSMNTGCWRGYIAEWKIINKELFLSKLYSCDTKNQFDINEILEGEYCKDQLKADWVSGDIKVVYGGIYKQASYSNYFPLYKCQSLFILQNGIIKDRIDYNSSNSIFTQYSDNPQLLQEYIYKNLDWYKVGKIDSTYVIRFIYECDSLGYVSNIQFNRNTNSIIENEIRNILENKQVEAIYYFGKFIRIYYFLPVEISEDNKLKYSSM